MTQQEVILLSPRLRAALRAERERTSICEQPTQEMRAVQVSREQISRPLLPLDAMSRPRLFTSNPYEDTLKLVEALVKQFVDTTGGEPREIYLSALRYFTFGIWMKCYYPDSGSRPIPYVHEPGVSSYEVMVKG